MARLGQDAGSMTAIRGDPSKNRNNIHLFHSPKTFSARNKIEIQVPTFPAVIGTAVRKS
jgi:hypothetical protein